MRRKYKVITVETSVTIQREYVVDAESEDEARSIVEHGECECLNEDVGMGEMADSDSWEVIKT